MDGRREGETGLQKARMARVQHTEAPWNAGWRRQVLPAPVEIEAGVKDAEWNWQRALQKVKEEWKVRTYV
jgi:hypothetical protein